MPDQAPTTTPSQQTAAVLERAVPWRVIVLDDPVNLMSYVVLVFRKILGFDEDTARKHMLEVHNNGRSVVWSGHRENAEAIAYNLQQWHLSAVLEPEDESR